MSPREVILTPARAKLLAWVMSRGDQWGVENFGHPVEDRQRLDAAVKRGEPFTIVLDDEGVQLLHELFQSFGALVRLEESFRTFDTEPWSAPGPA